MTLMNRTVEDNVVDDINRTVDDNVVDNMDE